MSGCFVGCEMLLKCEVLVLSQLSQLSQLKGKSFTDKKVKAQVKSLL